MNYIRADRIKRWVVWLLQLLTPKLSHVTIYGYPEAEGNAIEMVRATAERYAGRVFLLTDNLDTTRQVLECAGLDKSENVVAIPHHSFTALFRYVTAEVSMFTHGIFGGPPRVPRKTLVNLWHGDGIKAGLMMDARGRPLLIPDYLVMATLSIGETFARRCRLPAGGLLLTGCPRVDQFDQLDPARIADLGIDPDSPFVVWMPTFRRSNLEPPAEKRIDQHHGTQMVDAFTHTVIRELANAGIQTVVKPHPSDADNREIDGGLTVTDEMLIQNGIFLYQLIGVSDGLLTDYSSVFIDYLTLDRPMGFIVPDEDMYDNQRGFDPPDALDWLPGPRIRTTQDIKEYAEDVKAGGALTATRRHEVAKHLGLATARPVSHRILDKLSSQGVFGPRIRTESALKSHSP